MGFFRVDLAARDPVKIVDNGLRYRQAFKLLLCDGVRNVLHVALKFARVFQPRMVRSREERPILLRILIIIAVLIAVVLVFAATKPNTLRVTRSIVIKSSPETIFALLDDFHNWVRWSPQDREDPTMVRTYSGPTSGVGASSAWEARGNAGNGRMSITESLPATDISIAVDFVKPFHAHNVNRFTLEPNQNATKVTWTMEGTNVYVTKVMSIFVDMDRLMGKHFETGLSNLKRIAEQ